MNTTTHTTEGLENSQPPRKSLYLNAINAALKDELLVDKKDIFDEFHDLKFLPIGIHLKTQFHDSRMVGDMERMSFVAALKLILKDYIVSLHPKTEPSFTKDFEMESEFRLSVPFSILNFNELPLDGSEAPMHSFIVISPAYEHLLNEIDDCIDFSIPILLEEVPHLLSMEKELVTEPAKVLRPFFKTHPDKVFRLCDY